MEGNSLKILFRIFLSAIFIGIAFIVFVVYSFFYGNPFLKYKFKQEARHYLESTYPNKQSLITEVEFSLKSSTLEKQYFRAYFYFLEDKIKKLHSVYINDDGKITDGLKTRAANPK
ncbi:YfjL-like protein [Paenibacillus spongiae]|uniref:YfjL-like protein n=1 Tax=Paenibacillus spongiae TaxID=2909671 RepID=UPI00403A84D8